MDDDDLVARVAAGDDAALRELFGRHAPWHLAALRAGRLSLAQLP
jgi:RNA polymerase sigma-70 factor, ECF subfamily